MQCIPNDDTPRLQKDYLFDISEYSSILGKVPTKERPSSNYPRNDWNIRLHNKAWLGAWLSTGLGAIATPLGILLPKQEILENFDTNNLTVLGCFLLGIGLLSIKSTENGNETVAMYKKRIDLYRRTGRISEKYRGKVIDYCFKVGGKLAAKDIRNGDVNN